MGTSISRDVSLSVDQPRPVRLTLKPGRTNADVRVNLRGPDGRVAAAQDLTLSDPALKIEELSFATDLVVATGAPAGLVETAREPDLLVNESFDVARLASPADLPAQWFAYQGVRALVITTREASVFDRIDPAQWSALSTWVRQGGKLVVSVATNWQVAAQSPLGPMLPAKLQGDRKVRAPASLESFAKSKNRLEARGEGMTVASIAAPTGAVLASDEGAALIVHGAYGLGTVTLLTFDLESEPFRGWEGTKDFWISLFDLKRAKEQKGDSANQVGQFAFQGRSDAASLLHAWIEDFPMVTVVPFRWVAVLIIGYILLIGPIDYFFLKRVIGRLEWTWVTFPVIVSVVSAGAYFAAHWLKGDELRVNRIDVVDIDQRTATLRGTGFVSIFSPRIDRYDVAMTPALTAGTWSDLGMGRVSSDRVMSWLGLPEQDAFRGVGAAGSGLFGSRAYFYDTFDATGLRGVPIQVWSVKSLVGRWLAKAPDVIKAELRAKDLFLAGRISNLLDAPLSEVLVFHGDYVRKIDAIPAKGVATVDASRPLPLKSFLVSAQMQNMRDPQLLTQARGESLTPLLTSILFARKVPEGTNAAPSLYLSDLDLSDQLRLGRVVIMAKAPRPGGELWLNAAPESGKAAPPIAGAVESETYLRVLIDLERDSR